MNDTSIALQNPQSTTLQFKLNEHASIPNNLFLPRNNPLFQQKTNDTAHSKSRSHLIKPALKAPTQKFSEKKLIHPPSVITARPTGR